MQTHSATWAGPEGVLVEVEASRQNGLPAIVVTGLPSDTVKESRERIKACLVALGFDIPSTRTVVHLSPANARKQGSQLDLAIATAVLALEGHLISRIPLHRLAFLGELTLDGRVRGVKGALAMADALVQHPGVEHVFVPEQNLPELQLLECPKIVGVSSLTELMERLSNAVSLSVAQPQTQTPVSWEHDGPGLDEVHGQYLAKRALQIALAGRHHLLFVGPPGVGKSLLAQCAHALVPPLSKQEAIERIKCEGGWDRAVALRPALRSPHHSISAAGLLGGGTGKVTAGEITAAHGGILFLDEWAEFRKDALEGLREPLQSKEIYVGRVGQKWRLPADFILIAAMNPCPCGYALDPTRRCRCPADRVIQYRRKISGPLYDRIDLCVILHRFDESEQSGGTLSHAEVKASIERVRRIQQQRPAEVKQGELLCDPRALNDRYRARVKKHALSYRAINKLARVARTIADLAESESINEEHWEQAWELRCRDLGAQ